MMNEMAATGREATGLQETSIVVRAEKNTLVLVFLWLSFGAFGGHWYYLNRFARGLVMPALYFMIWMGGCVAAGASADAGSLRGDAAAAGYFGSLFANYLLLFGVWVVDGYLSFQAMKDHNKGG